MLQAEYIIYTGWHTTGEIYYIYRLYILQAEYIAYVYCFMALGSTQPLTEMSTKNISWLVKAAAA